MDVFGEALLDYQHGKYSCDITTYSSLNEESTLNLAYLFRDFEKMPVLERKALKLCKGEILDIGCGAGSHSLYLHEKKFNITALDNSKGAIKTCSLRGIKQTVHTNILAYKDKQFDTLLLLMNGIGIVGKLEKIDMFLSHLKKLLKPNGHILLDSTDIIYMFDEDNDGGRWIPNSKKYYGEVTFTLKYKKKKSNSFHWLYVDYNTLHRAAEANNLTCEILAKGDHYDYLARLTK